MKALLQPLCILALILTSGSANLGQAQSGVFRQVSVTLSTPDLTFTVDGAPYNTSQVFRWQIGDVHVIRVPKGRLVDSLPALGGGNNSAIGTRTTYEGGFSVVTDAGTAVPLGVFQDLTTSEDTEYVYRIQVWSFLSSIEFTTTRLYQLRFVTPISGCAPTASGQPMPGACSDVPGYTSLRCSDGVTFPATTGDYWCPAGETELTAVPGVGYAFKDWNAHPGLPTDPSAGTTGSLLFTLTSPFHIQVNFGPGKLYRLNTEPAGFEVTVDGSIVRTGQVPFDNRDICSRYEQMTTGISNGTNIGQGGDNPGMSFCTVWLVGGTRTLGAKEMQLDQYGKPHVFDSWSFGGGQDAQFQVSGPNLSTDVITAKFLPAGSVTFVTQPRLSIPLIVNNRTWASYNFWFGANKDIVYSAPFESTDVYGRRWRFKGWSHGGPATQTLHISQEIVDKGLYLVANYERLNTLTIDTNPSGLLVTVDGEPCQTPCVVGRLPNESVNIVPIQSVTQAKVLRLEFDNWTDGGPAERTVGFGSEVQRLVANYKQLYLLSAIGNPPPGASFTFNPDSVDHFYDLGTQVTITVATNKGYRFRRWSGDASGTLPSTTVTIGGPRGVVAQLDEVPYLDPAGVKNAAGTGPQDLGDFSRVAPGSLISLFGVNLTPKEEVGPKSPQAQTLAELAVKVGERILPLSYASGSRVDAQLPFDLPLGPNTLTIHRVGQPSVAADFEIVRNAPGLFGQPGTEAEGTPPLALAYRANGTMVTESNPASANEVVNLIGTGLGGYRSNPPAGFAIPQGAEFALVEPVEVLVNGQTVQPLKVIATPGFVGMTSIQVRLSAPFTPGQSSTVTVRVNGKESNKVRVFAK